MISSIQDRVGASPTGMLQKDEWSLDECAQADDVRDKLIEAINRCRAMKVPCPLASAALQQFYSDGLSKR